MRPIFYIVAFLFVTSGQAQDKLSLSLADCRKMALAHNEVVQLSDNQLRQAEMDKSIAHASYFPKIEGSVRGTYLSPDIDMMGMELQMRGMYMAGISVTQPLFVGGKIRESNKLAQIGKESAIEQRRHTRMQLIADVDNAYWSYIAVIWKVKMLNEFKLQMDTLYSQSKTSLLAGMSTSNDMMRIDAKRSEIVYQLQKAANGANLCRLALSNVLGSPMDVAIEPTDTIIPLPILGQLDESIALRPELILLERQVEASQRQVKIARSDMLPQLGLSAGYMYNGNIKIDGTSTDELGNESAYTQKINDGNSYIMASLSVPIFHWGEGRKKVERSKLDVENSKLDLQRNSRLLSLEARQAVHNVLNSVNLIATADLGCNQSEENLRVMRMRYHSGMCSLTDLLDAQTQWQQAKSNLIEAQTQFKIQETEYLRVTGRLE